MIVPLEMQDKISRELWREIYGWWIAIGPLLIRPDSWDPSHRKVINYYWCGKYVLTSARRYVIVPTKNGDHLWLWHDGRIHYQFQKRVTA